MTFGRILLAVAFLLVGAAAAFGAPLQAVPTDPAAVRSLPVGSPGPHFEVRRPQIVICYRGGWCPYRNAQLSDLRHAEEQLRAQGFDILFMSTDRPQILYSSLKEPGIHCALLSDAQMTAAHAFHIAFHLDDATIAQYRKYGVDLETSTGTTLHELPVPSVFISDTGGTVHFVYSNPDYKVRLHAQALLKAAGPYRLRK